jgi:hypothetical protein
MKDTTDLDRDGGNEERASQRTIRPGESLSKTPADRPTTSREPMTRESARTNPEVMERQRNDRRALGPGDPVDPWPEMSTFVQRFDKIQAEFIDEPRAAVQKAETLVAEAIDHMMVALHEQIRRIHSELGDEEDTERLRVAMKSYKTLIHYLKDQLAA